MVCARADVMFSWCWFWYCGIFYYFFLDFRKEWSALMQLGLVGALAAFYALAWALSSLAVSSYWARAIAIGAAAGVMHF